MGPVNKCLLSIGVVGAWAVKDSGYTRADYLSETTIKVYLPRRNTDQPVNGFNWPAKSLVSTP